MTAIADKRHETPHYSSYPLTAAELFLVPQVFNARRFNVDMEQFPTIAKIDAHCKDQPAFVKAHPLNQPDTPAI